MATLKNTIVNDTGFFKLPVGTEAQKTRQYIVKKFLNPGAHQWTCPTGVTSVEVLVVGGGGGGGRYGGGGGAGGLVYNSNLSVTPGTTYNIFVGQGGEGWPGDAQSGGHGGKGRDSIFHTITAYGGGGGGCYSNSSTTGTNNGQAGGSGGGGGGKGPTIATGGAGGSASPAGQGNAGGSANDTYPSPYNNGGFGGGGGGAGGAGYNGSAASPNQGRGGPGLAYSITGSSQYYAGGGSGVFGGATSAGAGGTGGGGGGFYFDVAQSNQAVSSLVDGAYATGSGGGGTPDTQVVNYYRAGNGGSGCIIVKYLNPTSNNSAATGGMIRFNDTYRVTETYNPRSSKWTLDWLDDSRRGIVMDIDTTDTRSYSYERTFVSAKVFSVFNSLRSANYTVQYSDDNSSWTTAFSGVMSNNSSYGVQTGTITSGAGVNYGTHRYWRYVEGAAVVSHHPRVSRIILVDSTGYEYDIVNYTEDNHVDSGTYIVGTVSYDFATTAFDLSGFNNNCILQARPQYAGGGGRGGMYFDQSGITYGRVEDSRSLRVDLEFTLLSIFKIADNQKDIPFRQSTICKHYADYEQGIYQSGYQMGSGVHTYTARGVGWPSEGPTASGYRSQSQRGIYNEGGNWALPGNWESNRWYFLLNTMKGPFEECYINGIKTMGGSNQYGGNGRHIKGEGGTWSQASSGSGNTWRTGHYLSIGTRIGSSGGLNFKGVIAVAKVWNRALSDEEIYAIYASYKTKFGF